MDDFRAFVEYLTTAEHWWGPRGIATRTSDHVQISVLATLAAVVLAVPPAVWLGHRRRGAGVAIAVVNIGRAVPSFAVVALGLPISLRYGLGLGFWPTFVALVALALPPIFTNTYAGVAGVDRAVVDAARGMGLVERQVVLGVEVPSALPLILTGVRISAVQVVATATLGAYVGFGGLGAFITAGFANGDRGVLLTGAVLVAVLAVLTEALLGAVQRPLTPWLHRKGTR